MFYLSGITETVQQVAEAIALVLGVETEIVDEHLTIIGGTGIYKEVLGQKEELGLLDSDFLYARVLRTGMTTVIEDTLKDLNYDPLSVTGEIKELAEICTPIKVGHKIIGVIGLIALAKCQQQRLVENREVMVLFVERMAELLGAKASETEHLRQVELAKHEITTILETIHEGVLAVDGDGFIVNCNSVAETLLKSSGQEIVGKHLSLLMPNTLALQVRDNGQSHIEIEEIFERNNRHFHFIVTAKPVKGQEKPYGVVISFRDIAEARKLVNNLSQNSMIITFDDIIGASGSITKVKNQAFQVAKGNSTILITGGSGTGKEMFARAIHDASPRQKRTFITVNCGAIPENLLESELFGYESGAFTGAKEKGKAGKFELANGGTVFLDEIGELPLHLQVKLLHVLQNKRFERVGGTKTISVDVRVIAATNRDLEEMIVEREFREDLYYRLNVIPLKIPSLSERTEDIPLLMNCFLQKYNLFMNKNIRGFTKDVENIFSLYNWPGNIRELENAVEYGVNMTFDQEIKVEAIPPRIKKLEQSITAEPSLQEQIKIFEKELLLQKLANYGNSMEGKLAVGNELGISRATLYRKLAEHGISHL